MIAPEPILRAANDTVKWGCVYIRNQTLQDGVSVKMINDMMEAIHEIPSIVTNWGEDSESTLRLHLRCFPHQEWESSPNLLSFYEARLREYGG